jgi:hypothetical protein
MKEFNKKIQEQFDKMSQTGKLFRVELTGQQIWDLYLRSFTKENNPIFRDPTSTTHNCNHCNNFIRRYGNIVAIDDNHVITSIFDVDIKGEYKDTALALSKAITSSKISEVFFETFTELNSLPYESCSKSNERFQLGTASNVKRYTPEEAAVYGVVKANETRTFNHMHLFVNRMFVDSSGKSVEAIMGEFRDAKNVFQHAMEEISIDTLYLVRDLINQGSLLDGASHLYKIEHILPLKKWYDELPSSKRDNYCWLVSYKMPFAKFRNELIGVLCTELAEGKELNEACTAWNKRVDPANYMKTTAPITQKQINEAKLFVEENGYVESFNRRFAHIDDIKVSEILHSNVGKGEIKSASIFDNVKSTSTRHKRSEFDGVEEVGIEKFMKDILPGCTGVEVFLNNTHENHMVSLTTSNVENSKPIFKWSNNYSWTFNGNLAGRSQIKQAVKDAGGNVEGVLNFRLAWNDGALANDNSDLDAWASEPGSRSIGFNTGYRKDSGNKRTPMSGQLDVDNTLPNGKMAVENITWTDKDKMYDGIYRLWVNPWSARNSLGFKAEIEFDGETYSYEFNRPVTSNIVVAEVTLKNGVFTIKHVLPESAVSSKDIYGLETNQFHRVNLICLSPNHWAGNNVGNKHYFFMIDGCKAPQSIRSFHNENLIPELAAHRKVLEVLGATNMIAPADKQLSGLGFNATVRDELVVKLQGTHKRTVKIKF